MTKKFFLTFALCTPLALTACSGAKESLGLTKEAPDEFYVVRRAPLELPPPDYTQLQKPVLGAQRPQEQTTKEQAQKAVFGMDAAQEKTISTGESALLKEAGAYNADPSIRETVNAETLEQRDRNKPVAQKLLGIGGDRNSISATIVDAEKEAARLKENKEKGLPPTHGETPTRED